MTQLSHSQDGQRAGNITACANWNGGQYGSVAGFPSSNVLYYYALPAAAAVTAVSASASPGAGAILIDGTLATAGVATLDVPRCVTIISGSDDSLLTFTVTGTDGYGVTQIEAITGSNGGTATGVKAFKTVTAVAHTGSVAGTLSVGSSTKLGLPVACLKGPFLVTHQAGTVITPDAGTLVVGSTTNPQLITSTDPRGTYAPSGTLNGSNAVILGIFVPDPGDYNAIRGVTTYGG